MDTKKEQSTQSATVNFSVVTFAFLLALMIGLALFYFQSRPGTLQAVLPQTDTIAERFNCQEEIVLRSESRIRTPEIEEFIGFSHYKFVELVAEDNNQVFGSYRLTAQCKTQNGIHYIALHYSDGGVLQIYEIENSDVRMVYSVKTFKPSRWVSLLGFADRNDNGQIEFAAEFRDEGNAPCISVGIDFHLIERDENGQWYNIVPDDERIDIGGFDDLNHDGVPELYGMRYYRMPTTFAYCDHITQLNIWYKWNGIAYEQISVFVGSERDPFNREFMIQRDAVHDISYYSAVIGFQDQSSFWQNSANNLNCTHINDEQFKMYLYATLLYHYVWDRMDLGWQVINPVLEQALLCDPTPELEAFQETIEAFREYFQQLAN